MTSLEDEIRAALRTQADAFRVPERPAFDREVVERRQPGHRWLLAAACLVLIASGVLALTLLPGGDTEPTPPVDSVVSDRTDPDPTVTTAVPDVTASTPVTNGWVAVTADQEAGSHIYLVRPGGIARQLEVPGSDIGDDACPAWSPDGTRLLFGRLTTSSDTARPFDAQLLIVPIDPAGTAGDPNVIALDGFEALEGFQGHPCGIWAPDGRWVAFAGGGDVWVVDTHTGEIRRLPDLRPSDLEWRPGNDQLAIAGDMGANRAAPTLSTPVTLYTVSTGNLAQLGSVSAAHFTWSPDGSTLAYEGGEDGPGELRLVDADGTNDRLLVADRGEVNHGIGPIWSPIGDRIAYQRICCSSAEKHEVVLVNVADGSEAVIEPPQTDGMNEPKQWYPYTVTWSPDGTTLLYTAWGNQGGSGTIAVTADTPTDVTVLSDTIGPDDHYSHRWVPTQRWGRQPPTSVGATTLATGDVEITGLGFSGLSGQTLSVDAEQRDGKATGEFRVGNVVVAVQCSGSTNGGRDLILGGVVTENVDGPGRLDETTVAVGDLLALVIRHDDAPDGRTQRVTLYQPSLWYGEQADEHAGSCTALVESVPPGLDGGFFDDVDGDGNIETR
jgi:Tol biopolymer transport system component